MDGVYADCILYSTFSNSVLSILAYHTNNICIIFLHLRFSSCMEACWMILYSHLLMRQDIPSILPGTRVSRTEGLQPVGCTGSPRHARESYAGVPKDGPAILEPHTGGETRKVMEDLSSLLSPGATISL